MRQSAVNAAARPPGLPAITRRSLQLQRGMRRPMSSGAAACKGAGSNGGDLDTSQAGRLARHAAAIAAALSLMAQTQPAMGAGGETWLGDGSHGIAASAWAPISDVAAVVPAPATASAAPLPLPTSFPPIPELRLPSYQQATLPNGLRVFMLEDHEVPLVRGLLLTRGGQVASPQGKVGLATVTAAVQRAGGTLKHPGPVLNDQLDDLAAVIEASAGQQALAFEFSAGAEDAALVLGLLAELVTAPAFPADKLSLVQGQVAAALEHRDDDAGGVARREAAKQVFGPDSIYARSASRASVRGLTVADLRAFAATWERPDAAVLGVVGDFEAPAMQALLGQAFGGWAAAPGQPSVPPAVPRGPPPPLPPASSPPRVLLVDRPGLAQASVALAEPGVAVSHPDAPSLDVLGGILNSFGGVLFDALRSRQGLAYSVGAGWDQPIDHAGLFVAAADTSSPAQLLKGLQRLLGEATQQPPSAAELAQAQAQAVNAFVFNFASLGAQLQRILVFDLLGLPQDFLFQSMAAVQGVSAADVQRAAAAHLHPGRQVAVVVADGAAVRGQLEAEGYEVLPLVLPEP